jgi:toxin-antitoxin system PIN domain toxin
VTLVDTNVLIYAAFEDAPEHDPARAWLEAELSAPDGSVELCWPVVYAFVRLATSPRVFGKYALAVAAGWSAVSAFLEQPSVRVVAPGARHAQIAAELARTPGLRSEDVPDLEIAALAIEHGLVLASHDSGFRRFAGLRTVDPLA